MRRSGHTCFKIRASQVLKDIFVPHYYDPEIDSLLRRLEGTSDLVTIGELKSRNEISMSQGSYIGKLTYGTGPYPYIRTSDIANWELRGSPKHGVSKGVYEFYRKKQDIRAGDILLVHEGTYLIGTLCLLTEYDTRIVLQHHLAKIRIHQSRRLSAPLLMAILMSPVVQRQFRAKQLTADTIDSIVGRVDEVVLPIPRDETLRESIGKKAWSIFHTRSERRLRLAMLSRSLDSVLENGDSSAVADLLAAPLSADETTVKFLGDRAQFSSFSVDSTTISSDILIPRYYEPTVGEQLARMTKHCHLVTIGELADRGVVDLRTGHEIGKLAYGTGKIPFCRTSDLGNWELKSDPKHAVSEEIYRQFAGRQPLQANDILIVRDRVRSSNALLRRNLQGSGSK